ncbi:MAG: hypothetical protein ACI84R_004010, partial [Candidatus Azotimanducaceae bacterium]
METAQFCAAATSSFLKEAVMALDNGIAQYEAPEKDLYEVGEMPP